MGEASVLAGSDNASWQSVYSEFKIRERLELNRSEGLLIFSNTNTALQLWAFLKVVDQ